MIVNVFNNIDKPCDIGVINNIIKTLSNEEDEYIKRYLNKDSNYLIELGPKTVVAVRDKVNTMLEHLIPLFSTLI